MGLICWGAYLRGGYLRRKEKCFRDQFSVDCVVKVKSRITGHHVYKYLYEIGEELSCFRERNNRFSDNAIVVQKDEVVEVPKKGSKKRKRCENAIVGHMPEPLSEIIAPLIDSSKITKVIAIITDQHRPAPEGTWVPGGGIEIPCLFKIFTSKEQKKIIRKLLKAGMTLKGNDSLIVYIYSCRG